MPDLAAAVTVLPATTAPSLCPVTRMPWSPGLAIVLPLIVGWAAPLTIRPTPQAVTVFERIAAFVEPFVT